MESGKLAKVLILIQARSNSERLPGKVHLPLGGRAILLRILDECNRAAGFINRQPKSGAVVTVGIACPQGDQIATTYRDKAIIYEGPEKDVLTRYVNAVQSDGCDYVVRVTGDCAFIPAFVISRHIKTALLKRADFTTNTIVRTFIEGYDCEVLSRRFLERLDKISTPEEREHVTGAKQRLLSERGFHFCHIFERFDMSGLPKTSVDTQEDYERAVLIFNRQREKREIAARYGEVIQ